MVTWQDNGLISYDQWKLKRYETIGASEVGTIVYGSPYTSNLELFYDKIGAGKDRVENIRMFLGKETEDTSRKLHSYYEGTEQSVVDNYRKGRKIRESINLNSTAFNDKYPHLSCTPDSEIQPFGIYEGRGKGTLEIKNTTSWYLNSFESGLPTDNVLQLMTQIIVAEYNYGELFYFIDNSKFQLHAIDKSEMGNIEETIMLHTIPFWDNVLKARPLYNQLYEAQRNMNQRLIGELQKEIAALEPPAQNTTGYLNFLSQKYKDKMGGLGMMDGNDAQLHIARKHKELKKQIDTITAECRMMEVELKNIIGDRHTLNFGGNGKVTWAADKTGKRTFLNKVKQ
jgi:predicted phage-related endonuclease